MRAAGLCVFLICLLPAFAAAQSNAMPGTDMPNMAMPGMQMPDMPMTGALGLYPVSREASGTSWQPDSAQHSGLHSMEDGWMLMAHARFAGVYDSQSGPRGDTMSFLSGWAMGMARRDLDNGDMLNLRAMLSVDPFMGRAGYPLLLASGETADGVHPLIDRQHPHDLFMELSASYAHDLSSSDSVFVYGGYPGEPALGPIAYMHRVSAMDDPETPISHHWLDSTHIAFGVATAGFVHDDWKLEVSQFTGREPDQYRFDFDSARFDSTAVRLSWNPSANWSLQASWGFLKSPEEIAPQINETRYTTSATYVLPFDAGSSFAATLAFGRKQLSGGDNENAALAEAEYKPSEWWTLFARSEIIQTEELLASAGLQTVGKFSLGAIHDWRLAQHLKLGLGGIYDFDFVGPRLKLSYDGDPHGAMLFVRALLD